MEANEELFVIAMCNQSPKCKRGVFDRSMVGREPDVGRSLALAALIGQ